MTNPLSILQDDREKAAIDFGDNVSITVKRLKTADYIIADIAGNDSGIACVEWKSSTEDLIQTLCHKKGRERFNKMGERAQTYGQRILAIGPTYRQILKGSHYSRVPGHVIVKAIIRWGMDYGFHIIWGAEPDVVIAYLKEAALRAATARRERDRDGLLPIDYLDD